MFFKTDVSIWAVLVAATVPMIIGTLWYSKLLFGRQWMALLGKKPGEPGNPMLGEVASSIGAIITSIVLALLVTATDSASAAAGATLGFLCWLAFNGVPAVSGTIFARQRWALFAINSGYSLVTFVIMGIILAVW
jgi:hypothetical protein